MAGISITSATLRIFGDDLVPDELTLALGTQPTRSGLKGEIEVVGRPPAKTGFWNLSVQDREPGDLDAQITELFTMVSADLFVWRGIREKFVADIFCGLFMNETNEGER